MMMMNRVFGSKWISASVQRSSTVGTATSRTLQTRLSSSLVSPEWLRASGPDQEKVMIVDCDHPVAFQRAHIPHATSFYGFKATSLKDTRGGTGVISKGEFQQLVDIMGVDGEETLVFYDDELSIGATRAWWVFLHYGYPKDKLKILDGGWKQWTKEIGEISTSTPPHRQPQSSPSFEVSATKLIGLDDVQEALINESTQFVDSRSHAEYTGTQANGNDRTGHIPGAMHFDWREGVDTISPGRFKSKSELEQVLVHERELTSDLDHPLVTYCQRGIRAAHTAFVLQEILGYRNVKIYEDSMAEYLNRDDTIVDGA